MNIVDIFSMVNLVLIMGSFFLALGILSYLKDGDYVLARGWKYVLPAVIVFAIISVYEFFTQYGSYTSLRVVKEIMYLVFSGLLFFGLLTQYNAICEAVEGRGRK